MLVQKGIAVYTMENAKILTNARRIQKYADTVRNVLTKLVLTNATVRPVTVVIRTTECARQLKKDVLTITNV